MGAEDRAIAERLDRLKASRRAEQGPTPSQGEIESRLQGLKGDRPAPPSEQEMRDRLAQLKGEERLGGAKGATDKLAAPGGGGDK